MPVSKKRKKKPTSPAKKKAGVAIPEGVSSIEDGILTHYLADGGWLKQFDLMPFSQKLELHNKLLARGADQGATTLVFQTQGASAKVIFWHVCVLSHPDEVLAHFETFPLLTKVPFGHGKVFSPAEVFLLQYAALRGYRQPSDRIEKYRLAAVRLMRHGYPVSNESLCSVDELAPFRDFMMEVIASVDGLSLDNYLPAAGVETASVSISSSL